MRGRARQGEAKKSHRKTGGKRLDRIQKHQCLELRKYLLEAMEDGYQGFAWNREGNTLSLSSKEWKLPLAQGMGVAF